MAFWASAKKQWLGKDLVGTEMTYGHLAAGRAHWSDHKFFRSAELPSKRHYIIAGTLPTGVVGIGEVPREVRKAKACYSYLASARVLSLLGGIR